MTTSNTINNIEDLRALADIETNENGVECFISLAGGSARSSKHIWYSEQGDLEAMNEDDNGDYFAEGDDYRWVVKHEASEHEVGYRTDEELLSAEENIAEGMKAAAFFAYQAQVLNKKEGHDAI